MPNYKESAFPITYRATQIQELMDAVRRLRSIAVFGLAGMGKSNIFRFVMAHPRVKSRYLGSTGSRFVFVFVDCNLVEPQSQEALLEAIDIQLERAGVALPEKRKLARPTSLRLAIQERLEHLDPRRVVVILLDPLDVSFHSFEPHFWSYLRGLRDLQGNVVFVLGARRPPPPLRELQELLAEACWIPPLAAPDAFDSLCRDGKRLGIQFSEQEKEQLVQITGGHPGLLKNAAELVGLGQVKLRVNPPVPTKTVIAELLANGPIQDVCRELSCDLELSERKTLQWICLNAKAVELDEPALLFLQRAGLVQVGRGTRRIFCPLWQEFLKTQMERTVRVNVGTAYRVRVESWQGTQMLNLSEGSHHLLRAMAQTPHQIFSRTQLSHVLYLGDPDYSREALAAQVKRLRQALNQVLRNVVQDKQFNALVPERKQGYRLNLLPGTGWTIEYHVTS